jgi:DNA-binding CsgD family transcriptional regulator
MCLGRESIDQPRSCALAEGVFSALPWPCVVWPMNGGRAVMVNAAFEREFGLGRGRVGPGWLDTRMEATPCADEYVFRDPHAPPRRYRLQRQPFDVEPEAFQAVFLIPLLRQEPAQAEVAPLLARLRPDVSLTRRESQVLDGIMGGKLNKVIASELKISPKTVELHRANLMAKLRVHNVVELARAVLDAPATQDTPEAACETP